MPIGLKEVNGPRSLIAFSFQGVTSLTKKDIYKGVGILILFLELYAALYLSIGKTLLPSGKTGTIMVIWLASMIGSFLSERLYIPGPVGMILSGIFLSNVDNGYLVKHLSKSWSKEIRAAALSIIFLRSGLELDLSIFKKGSSSGWVVAKLLLIPGVIEAFFDGGLAIAFFGMPPTFAFAIGFILKAVGPALVIQCMFEVQQKRLGTGKLIPATVVAAASFDDMVAITGYTIFINIAVQKPGNTAWQIAHGPLSVVLGILAGALGAVFCSFTKLWDNTFKRTCSVLFTALLMKYFFDIYEFSSGGALGSLTLGLVVKELWSRGWPSVLAIQEDAGPDLSRQVEKIVRWFWKFIMMPLLFGLIGATIHFDSLPPNTIPKACGIILPGLVLRACITFFVMMGSGFTLKEKLFFAIAWTPKATVQAALAASPLDQVNAAKKGQPDYDEYRQWAEDGLTTAVFCILFCGTIGTILIRWLSPHLLEEEVDPDARQRIIEGRISSGPHLEHVSPAEGITNDAIPPAGQEVELTVQGSHFSGDAKVAPVMEGYLKRLDAFADGLDQTRAQDLRVILGEAKVDVQRRLRVDENLHDIEGADDFMHATRALRRRHPAAHPETDLERGGSGGPSTSAVSEAQRRASSEAPSSRRGSSHHNLRSGPEPK